jgi:hypothetical protein
MVNELAAAGTVPIVGNLDLALTSPAAAGFYFVEDERMSHLPRSAQRSPGDWTSGQSARGRALGWCSTSPPVAEWIERSMSIS